MSSAHQMTPLDHYHCLCFASVNTNHLGWLVLNKRDLTHRVTENFRFCNLHMSMLAHRTILHARRTQADTAEQTDEDSRRKEASICCKLLLCTESDPFSESKFCNLLSWDSLHRDMTATPCLFRWNQILWIYKVSGGRFMYIPCNLEKGSCESVKQLVIPCCL